MTQLLVKKFSPAGKRKEPRARHFLGGVLPATVTLCITLRPTLDGGSCVSGAASWPRARLSAWGRSNLLLILIPQEKFRKITNDASKMEYHAKLKEMFSIALGT